MTSPEVGPLFGELMVNACHRWWVEMGSPEPFTVIDLGTGPGTLLRSMEVALRSRPASSWGLIGLDRAGPHGDTVWPTDLANSVVIGNEVLDNIPFRVIETHPDGPLEIHVAGGREHLVPADPTDHAVASALALPGVGDLPAGTRLPVLDGAAQLVRDVLARRPGRLCLIDYGLASTARLALRGGWLRAYRDHQRVSGLLDESVVCDITTDIGFDQLPPPDDLVTQAEFLDGLGLATLVDEGRRHWRANAASPDVTALRMRSRLTEAEALVDPDGLGSWLVACW